MQCPKCHSTHIRKNGFNRQGKQNYICATCGRQFITNYEPHKGYPDEVKQQCLKMYVNGMGLRAIQRVTGVHHTTIITWIKAVGKRLPQAYPPEPPPEVTELDELETFVGKKKRKVWLWTAVDHFRPGILGWVLGDRSSVTFQRLWTWIACWSSYFYVTDGWPVYRQFIASEDHIVSKTYMTRVEGENTRLRHYLARLHRQTLCYSKSVEMLGYSLRLLIHYLKFGTLPALSSFIA